MPAFPLAYDGTLNDSGAGSLRAAITAANMLGASNSSILKVSAASSGLSIKIDATSTPTHTGSTRVVEIDANGHAGFVFAAGSAGSQLLGVAVDNAAGPGVTLDASSITLNSDYIGVNLAGAGFGNCGDGVYVSPTSSNNFIGLYAVAASGVVANLSGNTATD